MGPEPGEAGDGLAQRQVIHSNAGLGDDLLQTGRGGVGAVPILHVDGRGANNRVAVDRGADQNTLAQLAGELENCVLHKIPRLFIQQAVVSPAGGDVQLPFRNHIVEHIRIDPGGIDHIPGPEVPTVRVNRPEALPSGKAQNAGIELECHAVGIGVLSKSDGHIEGADNSAGRGPQSRHSILAHIGLQFVEPPGIHNFQPLYPIFQAVFIEGFQPWQVLFGHTDHQRTVHPEWEIQLLGQLRHHPISLDVHLGHEAAMGGVVARMDDGAVGLGGAAAHIRLPLQNQHISLIAGQIPGHRAAGDTRSDDQAIVQTKRLLQEKSGSPRTPSRRRGLGCPTLTL